MKINSCKDLQSFLKAKKGFAKHNYFSLENSEINHQKPHQLHMSIILSFTTLQAKRASFKILRFFQPFFGL